MSIKILLADDHRLMREGLHDLLMREPDFTVVGEAATGKETVHLVRKLQPDVVLMDITMPDLGGIEATRRILCAPSPPKIIALSMHMEKEFITDMLRAGASGYVLKDCAFSELALAIRTAAQGKTYLSPDIADLVVEEAVQNADSSTSSEDLAFAVLTPREREVLQLIAEGRTTREIAAALGVSVKTIETHRQHIMEKLDLRSVAALTKYAVRVGLTSLDK